MDEVNFLSDGFLSNGEFHQLYSTIDIQDEVYLWDNRIDFDVHSKNNCWDYIDMNLNTMDYCSANDAQQISNFDENYSNFNIEFAASDSDSSLTPNQYFSHQYESVPLMDNGDSSGVLSENYLTDMDEWKQNYENDLSHQQNNVNNNDWELNLENLLFDTIGDSSIFNVDLPARTLYCNDSCANFLKETSEHLDISLQALRPHSNDGAGNQSRTPVTVVDRQKILIAPNEEKEFVCTYGDCRKVYAKAGHLRAHIRRHIGDKPYVCLWPNCTWKFSRSDELSRHRRSHSGIKPYKCDFCPKCFSRSDHLTKHRKVHERKMAAMKIKTVWTNLPPRKPGRKPKSSIVQE